MIWKFLYLCINGRYSRIRDEKCLPEAAMTRDREYCIVADIRRIYGRIFFSSIEAGLCF